MNNTVEFKYQYADYAHNHNTCGDGMNPLKRYRQHLCGEYTKNKTINSYYISAKQLIKITKNQINNETLQQYQHYINQHYPKQNSRRIRLHGANQYLRWLQLPYTLKLPPQENTNQRTLNEKQIDTILEIAVHNPETNLILRTLWDGCLRPHNIINLELTDRNDNILYLNQTKTGNHHIIMSKPFIEAWTHYLDIRPQPKTQYQKYLLINTWSTHPGEKYHSTHHILQTIKTLGKTAGIPYHITPYTIRRTSATLRQNRFSKYYAGDPKLVQHMFNHTDIRTTMKYNQITDNDIQKYLDHLYINADKPYLSSQNLIKNICVEDDNNSMSFSTTIFSSYFGMGVAI